MPTTLAAKLAASRDWSHFGRFDDDRNEFVVTTPTPPLPWDNYIFNDRYLSVVDHLGRGWSKLHTREGYVTFLWNLTAMYEREDNRYVYLRDDESGKAWSLSTFPMPGAGQFECAHGLGYTEIRSTTDGIRAALRITVPMGQDPVELWQVTVTNESGRPRKISVFTYGRVSLRGAATHGYIHFCQAAWRDDIKALYFQNNAPGLPHPRYKAFQAADFTPDSYACSKGGFTGPYGGLHNPLATETGSLPNAPASREPMAACFHKALSLKAGSTQALSLLAGIVGSPDEAGRFIAQYLKADGPKKIVQGVSDQATRMLASPRIQTPDAKLDRLINVWTKQQVALGAGWGRWGWRGYRDLVQQTHGANYFDLPRVKANLSESMTWQMRDGFCVRGWAPFSPKRYADSALWLCYTANDYVKESGDRDYMHRILPYRDGGVGPVWEHLMRGCHKAFTDTGPHGLPLIHQGDWNDSLSMVGEKGIGESTWIAEALCWSLLELRELFAACGLDEQAATVMQWHKTMADRVNEHAWDGGWYVRGFCDNGQAFGTAKNTEGRIYLNSQSWAILGQVVPDARRQTIIDAMEKHLRVPYGYLTLAPAYTTFDTNIGRITGMPPGTGENAAVYVHANAFMYAALLKLRQADRALELMQTVHPCNSVNPTENSGATPYVLPNSYYGPGYFKPGRIEGTWVTGSAGWYMHQTVEHMCGIHRMHEGLKIDPCLPTAWDHVQVHRVYRGQTFDFDIRRDRTAKGVSVTIDGKKLDKPFIPVPIASGASVSAAAQKVEVRVGS